MDTRPGVLTALTSLLDGATTMNLPPNQVPPADTLADVRTRITALYAIHALEIAGSLGGKPLCVVTGPRRFGKTTSLLPGLASILRGRGNTTHIMNGRDFEQEPLTVRALPGEQVDVLIVDEANVLTRTVKKTENVLRLLHTKATVLSSESWGWKKRPFHRPRSRVTAQPLMNRWMAECTDHSPSVKMVEVRQAGSRRRASRPWRHATEIVLRLSRSGGSSPPTRCRVHHAHRSARLRCWALEDPRNTPFGRSAR